MKHTENCYYYHACSVLASSCCFLAAYPLRCYILTTCILFYHTALPLHRRTVAGDNYPQATLLTNHSLAALLSLSRLPV